MNHSARQMTDTERTGCKRVHHIVLTTVIMPTPRIAPAITVTTVAGMSRPWPKGPFQLSGSWSLNVALSGFRTEANRSSVVLLTVAHAAR